MLGSQPKASEDMCVYTHTEREISVEDAKC